jgi:hypothetical protein
MSDRIGFAVDENLQQLAFRFASVCAMSKLR